MSIFDDVLRSFQAPDIPDSDGSNTARRKLETRLATDTRMRVMNKLREERDYRYHLMEIVVAGKPDPLTEASRLSSGMLFEMIRILEIDFTTYDAHQLQAVIVAMVAFIDDYEQQKADK